MIGIIIQARMGSSRLPGKVLKKIGDKALLDHILFRLSYLRHSVTIVIATSTLSKDDVMVDFCRERDITCFRGSEEHVLERYYLCAKQFGFKNIVRLTADNPFTDIDELDRLIDLHGQANADYSHSFQMLPVGVGAEMFSFEALEKSYQYGMEPHHIEHVNEYILDHLQDFQVAVLTVPQQKNRPDLRLTVDTSADYAKACYIVETCKHDYVTTEEAIQLCLQYA